MRHEVPLPGIVALLDGQRFKQFGLYQYPQFTGTLERRAECRLDLLVYSPSVEVRGAFKRDDIHEDDHTDPEVMGQLDDGGHLVEVRQAHDAVDFDFGQGPPLLPFQLKEAAYVLNDFLKVSASANLFVCVLRGSVEGKEHLVDAEVYDPARGAVGHQGEIVV
jgi:hypothetical protein